MSTLPIIETVKSAFTLCYFNLPSLAKIAMIPAAVVVGAKVLQVIVMSVLIGTMQSGGLGITGFVLVVWLITVVFAVVVLAALTPMATVWHQFILAVSDGKLPNTTLKWKKAEKNYFIHLLILAAAPFALQLIGVFAAMSGSLGAFAAILGLLSVAGSIALIFIMVRICLIFPALAIEEKTSFAKAFEQSKGVGWQLFAVLLLIGLAAGIGGGIILFVVALLFAVLGIVGQIVVALVSAAVTLATFAVLVAALSLAYREITGYRWS